MSQPPRWFTVLVIVALLWNVAGLLAVLADLRLTPQDIAALPAAQQAMYAARPLWSVVASVIAVAGGTLGCIALLLRKRWAILLFFASLVGVVVQDLGIFLVEGAGKDGNQVAYFLQALVLLIAIGLILLTRRATDRGWLS